jgi:hypothetical protein
MGNMSAAGVGSVSKGAVSAYCLCCVGGCSKRSGSARHLCHNCVSLHVNGVNSPTRLSSICHNNTYHAPTSISLRPGPPHLQLHSPCCINAQQHHRLCQLPSLAAAPRLAAAAARGPILARSSCDEVARAAGAAQAQAGRAAAAAAACRCYRCAGAVATRGGGRATSQQLLPCCLAAAAANAGGCCLLGQLVSQASRRGPRPLDTADWAVAGACAATVGARGQGVEARQAGRAPATARGGGTTPGWLLLLLRLARGAGRACCRHRRPAGGGRAPLVLLLLLQRLWLLLLLLLLLLGLLRLLSHVRCAVATASAGGGHRGAAVCSPCITACCSTSCPCRCCIAT